MSWPSRRYGKGDYAEALGPPHHVTLGGG